MEEPGGRGCEFMCGEGRRPGLRSIFPVLCGFLAYPLLEPKRNPVVKFDGADQTGDSN